MHEAAEPVEIGLHALGIDQQLLDDAGEAIEREIERHRRVRADHALDGRVRDVPLVPERDVLHRGERVGAHHAGEARDVLGQDRVPLMRHRRRAFLALGEELLGLEHFGALEVADFDGEAFARRGHDAEHCEEHGVAIARNDLRRNRLDREAELFGHMRLDPRIDVGEGADRARDRAGGDLLLRRDQALLGALELDVIARELQAEGGRLGVDAMAAADGGRVLVLERAALERRQHPVDVSDQDVGSAGELHRQAGVEHVGRRHALVDEARVRADELGEVGQERDDVVLGHSLDLVDALDVERGRPALFPDGLRRLLRDHADLGQRVAGMRLDLEPDAESRLRRPDVGHLGTRVTGDHVRLRRGYFCRRGSLARIAAAASRARGLNLARGRHHG